KEPVGYLGLLGPRVRREQILQKIGVPAPERLYAPVGLDVAPDGAEQVAVSIVAEMLAVRAGRPPMHLRDKAGGIHDRWGTCRRHRARGRAVDPHGAQ